MSCSKAHELNRTNLGVEALRAGRHVSGNGREPFGGCDGLPDCDPREPGPMRHVVMQRGSSAASMPWVAGELPAASEDIALSARGAPEARRGVVRARSDRGEQTTVASHRGGERSPMDAIVGKAPAIQRLRASIERIAHVPVDVLLIGETGSGKDLVLQQLHSLSRRPGPLVAVNCGAIPDTLFESELFGHEAGAFTGAHKCRPGKFEQAHRGTLFLDEIDSMPMHQQVKLLRVLEARRVGRIGGQGESLLDLRVVAASQGRLEERCKLGQFRLDLWHRLNVVTLQIPALRERREDVAPLFGHFVDEACSRYGVARASLPAIDMARLAAHGWPGNVRELKHSAERFVLGLDMLPDDAGAGADADDSDYGDPSRSLFSHLASCERGLIKSALVRHGRRLADVAAELAISEKTLSRRIAAYRLGAAAEGAA